MLSNFFNTVPVIAPDKVREYLEEDGSLATAALKDGTTALHKTCQGGNVASTKLLLEFGASVHATTVDEHVQPIHMAARSGNVHLLHHLVSVAGADIEARDKNDFGVFHYVAVGGNIEMACFLLEFYPSLKISSASAKNGQTPLHVACINARNDFVTFLLKKERCPVVSPDVMGNTALHYAAENGLDRVCWELLACEGAWQLKNRNARGLTPIDMVYHSPKLKEGLKPHFVRMLNSVLNSNERQTTFPDPNDTPIPTSMEDVIPNFKYPSNNAEKGIPEGPAFAYYWYIAMPGLLLLLASFPTYLLLPYHQGWITFSVLCLIIWTISKHSHRIGYFAKWPNLIYFGAYAGGFTHSLITLISFLLPTLWSMHQHLLYFWSVVVFTWMSWMYYALLTRDPGYTSKPLLKPDGHPIKFSDILATPERYFRKVKFCHQCEMFIHSKLVKHCRLCESLVHLEESGGIGNLWFLFKTLFNQNGWLAAQVVLHIGCVVWGISYTYVQLYWVSGGYTIAMQDTPIYHPDRLIRPIDRIRNIFKFLTNRMQDVPDTFDPTEQV